MADKLRGLELPGLLEKLAGLDKSKRFDQLERLERLERLELLERFERYKGVDR